METIGAEDVRKKLLNILYEVASGAPFLSIFRDRGFDPF